MKQSHNENRGIHSKSFIYWTEIGHCPSIGHSYIYRQHTMNGTIQKKKYSRSDSQGLLFVFECMVVIISSYILKRRFPHYKDRPSLWSYQYRELKIMPVQFNSIHTLQFNTWGHSLLELLHNGECISHIHIWPTLTTLTKTNAWPSCYFWKSSPTVAN